LTFALLELAAIPEANVKSTALTLLKRGYSIGAPHKWVSNAVNEQCKLG
jgi:hypothetical protein